MTLYCKELIRVLSNGLFILMTLGILWFASIQGILPPDNNVTKPQPNGTYGTKPSDLPALIMPEATASLAAQYSANHFITYPMGYYKVVKLGQADRNQMKEIVAALLDGQNPGGPASSSSALSWEYFCELMAEADQLLGGGSDFSDTWLSHRFGQIPVTYEEALADYKLVLSQDRITGAHARLFSDYLGIMLGLIPVFPGVFLCLRDRKHISPLLYTRPISSAGFILTRFGALVTASLLPVLLLGGILTGIHATDYGLANIDLLAYWKYTVFWLLPTLMAATATGLFFTTLTNTPVAIAIQLFWWFTDMLAGSGAYSFFGVRPFQLIPRHNELGGTGAYLDYLPDLIQNRIQITLIAVFMAAAAVCAFSFKRRGLLYVSLSKYRKVHAKA